ncbi:bifunctional 2-dehydro-3-deoxygluconokinase/2-dehydro-3-deoxygalactonokinase [Halegenticoccus tardaugens]|uniref:bifunctional 2-dehydro-3-deoxygluconokinase/2-dehydro-3- deoxygalactonokinase n=1 Tax=Halegenticoccus tardaugens TaxID=2071624 RepID=UPI00100BD043|nr:bifunctional 2-dehydro-3-deoxygluconokinase/2-dehydro-3-deoxygalactonokinase [Halegenticoccus tardaugens]
MTDLLTFGETMLRLSPPGMERLESADELTVYPAGAESNVAVAASQLGADATWLSKLPDSALGRKIVGELRANGVETEIVWSDEGRQGVYFVERGTEPRGTRVIYDRADSAVTTATTAELPLERIRDAEIFYTSGITPALSGTLAETTDELLGAAREAGTTTALDVNYRSKLWSPEEARETLSGLFPSIDALVVAIRDAREVLNFDGDAEGIAADLAAEWGFETVIVTRGEEGALALHDGTVHEQGIFEAETVDPVGTGDAFVGAFLARRLAGDGVPEALEYGAATAALKRTIPGDVVVATRAEIEAVLDADAVGIAR